MTAFIKEICALPLKNLPRAQTVPCLGDFYILTSNLIKNVTKRKGKRAGSQGQGSNGRKMEGE
jgi:hypothetical protein